MIKFTALALVAGWFSAACSPAWAAPQDIFHVTAAEKVACTNDAVRLCSATFPDEVKLLGCMKDNREALTPMCRVAFDAGVKRRHL